MRHWHTHTRVEIATLTEAFPGWSFRFDAKDRAWLGSAPVAGGRAVLSADSPDALRALIRSARGQTLVVP